MATLTLVGPRDRDGNGSMLERVEFATKVADELLVQVDPERLRRRDGKEGFDRAGQLEPEPVGRDSKWLAGGGFRVEEGRATRRSIQATAASGPSRGVDNPDHAGLVSSRLAGRRGKTDLLR